MLLTKTKRNAGSELTIFPERFVEIKILRDEFDLQLEPTTFIRVLVTV